MSKAMSNWDFIRVLNSPLKPFKLKFYFGKIAVGMPYFYPRKTIKDPDKPGYLKFIPKKFGFDMCGLGWKTKWKDTDYRLEWEPRFSFVFWKWQFAILFKAPDCEQYWTIWLYYSRNTDKSLSKEERIKQCIENFPQIWNRWSNGVEETINYYEVVLKEKYKPLSIQKTRDLKIDDILK